MNAMSDCVGPSVQAGRRQLQCRLADPFYYLTNFERVLSTLLDRYGDLLSAPEQQFISRFGAVQRTSRALLVRMIMRKGDLFRAGKLNYPEIGETRAAAAPLLEAGWVDARPALGVAELQALLTKTELVRHFSLPPWYGRLNKAQLVEILAGRFPDARPYQVWCAGSSDLVYRLVAASLCERFRLMFFGNFRQDWSEFVLADLGIFSYETIEPSAQSRAFRTRSDVEAFEQLHRCRELLEGGAPADAVHASLPPALDCDWLEDRRQKLLFKIGCAYEREARESAALLAYSECRHPEARVRVIRLHERARQWETARALCLMAQESPASEAERQQLRRLLPRMNRRLGMDAGRAPVAADIPSFELVLDAPAANCPAEFPVRDYLERQTPDGATVHYVENGLINSLFGLLCWRAIFAPVSGAFFHDFHHAPADLSSGGFYRRREKEFSGCLAQLESADYLATIRQTYEQKAGVQSPFVSWGLLSRALLERALSCFPAAHLRLWFEWIARDVQNNRAGFPDLVQFWPQQGRYRLIEVKGPGDRLQDNQRRLLEYCLVHRMPVCVCRVRWGNQ
jgi:VRR-NUC domain-containing protein/Fanconi-associated nuclease 1-like protein/Fanconi anemia protein nuclease-like protein